MQDTEFVSAFADAIGCPEDGLQLDTPLSSIDVWDSVAYLSVLTLVDEKMGVALNPEGLAQATSIGDILALARSQQATV
jgi:acyl carrier protein